MLTTKTTLGALVALCCGLATSNVVFWTRLQRLEAASSEARRTVGGEPVTELLAETNPKPALQTKTELASSGPAELAPYMGELQRLTHKLQLSVAADNAQLSEFYLYESRETVEELSSAVPEYRGHPIAILVGRTLEPAYAALEHALKQNTKGAELRASFGGVVAACNACHQMTNHAFIEIAEQDSDDSPYLQVFQPNDEHVAQKNH